MASNFLLQNSHLQGAADGIRTAFLSAFRGNISLNSSIHLLYVLLGWLTILSITFVTAVSGSGELFKTVLL